MGIANCKLQNENCKLARCSYGASPTVADRDEKMVGRDFTVP